MKRHRIIKKISAVLLAAILLQDIALADPDIISHLQVPSVFQSTGGKTRETALKSTLKYTLGAWQGPVEKLKLRLTPRVRLPGGKVATVDMDFAQGPKDRGSSALIVPCAISVGASRTAYEAAIGLQDGSLAIRQAASGKSKIQGPRLPTVLVWDGENNEARWLSQGHASEDPDYIPPTKPILRPDKITLDAVQEVGMKAAYLSYFERELRKADIKAKFPPYFVIPVSVAGNFIKYYDYHEAIQKALDENLERLGQPEGLKFGDPENPLLVSVRPSNPQDRPGRYVTILNIGLNDETVKGFARRVNDEKIAYNLYAKLIRDLMNASLGEINFAKIDLRDETLKKRFPKGDNESEAKWRVRAYKELCRENTGAEFPQDVYRQLEIAVTAASFCERARTAVERRAINAVMVEKMAFGVLEGSGSGYISSRNPVDGKNEPYVSMGIGRQGDDMLSLVNFKTFADGYPALAQTLVNILNLGERLFKDIVQIEFTVERGVLYILQIRICPRSAEAAVRAITDMAEEGVITKPEALQYASGHLNPDELLYDVELKLDEGASQISCGIAVAPGAASGLAVFDLETAYRLKKEGKAYILIKPEIRANDDESVRGASGVVSVLDMGNHAQSLSLKYRIPAVIGVPGLAVDLAKGVAQCGSQESPKTIINGQTVITIDRGGKIYLGNGTITRKKREFLPAGLEKLLAWQIEREGQEPVYKVLRWGVGSQWLEQVVETVDQRELDMIRNSVRVDKNRALVGIIDVTAKKPEAAKKEPEKEIRRIPKELVEKEAARVASEAHIEGFTYHLWWTYDNLDLITYGKDNFWVPSHIVYENAQEARIQFLRTVAETAPDFMARAVYHVVDRHKKARFIFRPRAAKYLDREFVAGFYLKVIKIAVEEKHIGANDYQASLIFATIIKHFPEAAAEILRRAAPRQRDFILKELDQLYKVRKYQEQTRDPDVPIADEVRQFLNSQDSRAQPTKAPLTADHVLSINTFMSFHMAFLTGFLSILTHIIFSYYIGGSMPSLAHLLFGELLLFEIVGSVILTFASRHITIAAHEMGHYIMGRALDALRTVAESPEDARKIESSYLYRVIWHIKMFLGIPYGKFKGVIKHRGSYYVDLKTPNLAISAAGPGYSRYLSRGTFIPGIVIFLGGLALNADASAVSGAILIMLGRLLFSIGVVSYLDTYRTDEGAYLKFKEREESYQKQSELVSAKAAETKASPGQTIDHKAMFIDTRMKEVEKHGWRLRLPWQFRNTLQGGVHVEDRGNISFQEFMIVPIAKSYEAAAAMCYAVQNRCEEILKSTEGLSYVGAGMEGGIIGTYRDHEEQVMKVLVQAIKDCRFIPGKDVFIALDPAASELSNQYNLARNIDPEEDPEKKIIGQYRFWMGEKKDELSSDEMIELYERWVDEYPIIAIEDGLAEDDHEGWKKLMSRLGGRIFIVGDDLVTTNDDAIMAATGKGLMNTVLIKPNQIGTLSETILAMDAGLAGGCQIIVSHRSKSADDPIEGDLALSMNAMGQKTGGVTNTERQNKYKVGQTEIALLEAHDEVWPLKKLREDTTIRYMAAKEIPTNAGPPTVEVLVILSNGVTLTAAAPVGSSAGMNEAVHRVDGDKSRYKGKGQLKVVTDFNQIIVPHFIGKALKELGSLVDVDRKLLSLERTLALARAEDSSGLTEAQALKAGVLYPDSSKERTIRVMKRKANLGMNAILPASMVLARVIARRDGLRLWQVLRNMSGNIDRDYLYGFKEPPDPIGLGAAKSISRETREAASGEPYLRDIKDPKELAQNLIETIASILITKKRLVLAFHSNIAGLQNKRPQLFLRQLEELKKAEEFSRLLENLVIVSFNSQEDLNKKLEANRISAGDVDHNLVFTFAPNAERTNLKDLSQAINAVFIDDGKDLDPLLYYYPLFEIITITLVKYLHDYTRGDIYNIMKDLKIDPKTLNIAEISDEMSGAFLIFTLIPKAGRYDMGQRVERYALISRFIETAV